ncbi:hypothetical protein CLV96_0309 [Leptospira meyeri]|uniref:STAS domain-containing protein n=1 Tax=Leptospira meyeri TaxID=29508 RepID=A0A4R8MUG4_LEPME|nr:hypothetical protein [Leptospira meyeri]EKJ84954.1 hypothetical protein LEP1GSC017_3662 [Leptospira meyeri serovar Hardjo str. Went 5]TDY71347.1 hypothetical protein CLV96_0309 [Leptospira meyeri]
MKLYFKKKYYKQWHDKRSQKIGRKPRRNKKYNPNRLPIYQRQHRIEYLRVNPIKAPSQLDLLRNTEECLRFFTELRDLGAINKVNKTCYVEMDISKVEKIDYSSVCVLIAISRDLKFKKIILRGNYPESEQCKKLVIESGLLTFMFDDKGKPFDKSEKSDLFFIEKGSELLSQKDNISISKSVQHVVKHLSGKESHFPKLRTIMLEICGNSIEWGETLNNQWLFGVKYEEEKVIFTITDVGKGILKTLKKKFTRFLKDVLSNKTSDEVLKGAFIKKYNSKTEEINRNKGLPSIKKAYDNGIISNLTVITNNVMLNFSDEKKSKEMQGHEFEGTLYRWEVTKDNLKMGLI